MSALDSLALSSGEDFIVRAGAVAAALVTLTMAFRMSMKAVVKQLTKAIHSELGPKVDRVYENTMELRPNGGSTVADAVRRLESHQLQIIAEQKAQRNELRLQREAIDQNKNAIIDHLVDHKRLPSES